MKIITLKITAAVKDGITPADVADAINLVADATAGFYACEIYGDETADAPKAAAPAASEAKPKRKYTRRSKADSATARQQTSGTTVRTDNGDGTVTEMRK